MTEKLKQHIQSMTDGQRSYFLYQILRRNISVFDSAKREEYNKFAVEFLTDLGTPMTYENCIKMLEMEERVCEQMKAIPEAVVFVSSGQQLLNIFNNVAAPVLQELGITLDTTALLFPGVLKLTYTNKQGESTTKQTSLPGDTITVVHSRYNVTKLYGDNSMDYRSLINLPLVDIETLIQ